MTTDETRKRWAALLVGTARNDAGMTTLPTVRNNLEDLRQVLTDPCLIGMDHSNVNIVADPDSEHEVLDPLARLADRELDLLLFYYAGHGQTDDEGHLFLATTQTPNRADDLEWRSVEFRRVQRVIRRAVADVRLVVLDCCFAGRALDVMASADAVIRGAIGTAGAVTWVASPASETAMAPSGERHTAFTGAILGHVTGDLRTPETDFLTLDTLVRQTRETLRSHGRPEPQVQAQGSGLDLRLVRRPSRTQQPTAPSTSQPPGNTPSSRVRFPYDSLNANIPTPQLDTAVKNRVGTPLKVAEVEPQKLPRQARGKWGKPAMTHIRVWQHRLAGFPSPSGTTWQLNIQLIGKGNHELYHLSVINERVTCVARLRHPAGIFHPVLEEMLDDFFWLHVRNGQITPDRFSMELSSPSHKPCELWLFLPKTLDEFTRNGIRSVGQEGINLRHTTIE